MPLLLLILLLSLEEQLFRDIVLLMHPPKGTIGRVFLSDLRSLEQLPIRVYSSLNAKMKELVEKYT